MYTCVASRVSPSFVVMHVRTCLTTFASVESRADCEISVGSPGPKMERVASQVGTGTIGWKQEALAGWQWLTMAATREDLRGIGVGDMVGDGEVDRVGVEGHVWGEYNGDG